MTSIFLILLQTDVRVRTGDCTDYLEASYIRLAGFPSAPAFKGAMRMISEMNVRHLQQVYYCDTISYVIELSIK